MSKAMENRKFKRAFKTHNKQIKDRSKSWGNTKFRPTPYNRPVQQAPVEETAKPWQHVKNDILEDEHEQRSSERFDMDGQNAKEFLKQREQNHRRNIIETKRNEKTKWESFDDDDDTAAKTSRPKEAKKPKAKMEIDPENLTFKERNFLRQKLTRSVLRKTQGNDLESAIVDMRRNKFKN